MQIIDVARQQASRAWRHRWKALALAWVLCLAGWTAVAMLPPRYEASARVYADADAVLSQLLRGITIDSAPGGQVELLQRTLLSRPNLERVIARTDLDLAIESEGDREAALRRLTDRIRFTAQSRNLFTIAYTDHHPRLARDVVQTVLNLFIEQASNNDRQQMEGARTFLNQQIATYEAQLRESEQRRADFRARYLELLPDGPGGTTGLEQARSRLRQLRGELTDMQQRTGLIRQQLEATPQQLAPGEGGGGVGGTSRVAEAESRLRELRLRFTDQHPDVVAARSALAEARASGGAGGGNGGGGARSAGPVNRTNPLHEQLRLRLVDVNAEIASHERQIREAEAEVQRMETVARSMPQVQAEFMNIDRDYNVLRRNYEELLGRREAVQIAGAARVNAERVRLEVVDPPTLPTIPSGPNRLLFASGVLLASLGAGGALALLLAQLDSSFYATRDLRGLGLPVLGSITLDGPAPRRAPAVAAFAVGVVLLLGAYATMVAVGPELIARLPSLIPWGQA